MPKPTMASLLSFQSSSETFPDLQGCSWGTGPLFMTGDCTQNLLGVPECYGDFSLAISRTGDRNVQLGVRNLYAKNSTVPVSRLYIEPAIFMLPLDSRARSTGLFSRMLAIVSDTFCRATASTNA